MNLDTAEWVARRLMAHHGLAGWSFKWDNAKRRAGQCRYESREISLSRPLVQLWPYAEVQETILHEIAHALADYDAGHGPAWKEAAQRIGAKPERCAPTDALQVAGRYTGTCPNGHTVQRHRAVTERTPPISCNRCAPRFDRRYLFTWSEN